MKRWIGLFTAVCAVLCLFSGCGGNTPIGDPLTVNGTPVSADIFCYYLDAAMADATLTTKEAQIEYATQQCIRYVALNSAFASRGFQLTQAEKNEVGERANALWEIFGAHYRAVGVSKQAFIRIRTGLAYTERLRTALFDTGGVRPVSDDTLKAYFSSNYVAFKVLVGRLYGKDVYGNRVEYSFDELSAVMDRYTEAADQINKGTAIDLTYATLLSGGNEEVRQSLTTKVISDGDPYYPEGFFNAVRSVVPGKAIAREFGDCVYLICRVDILEDPDLFAGYRADCLLAVSEPELLNEITEMCKAYTDIVRKTAAVNRCYDRVKQGRDGDD